MEEAEFIATAKRTQDDRYREAVELFGGSLERLARAYESDADKRRDLQQEIHLQLWRSFERYEGRCSLRTWVFRIAHHVAASHVLRERRAFATLVSLEELETFSSVGDMQELPDERLRRGQILEQLFALIQRLKPLDRQVIVSYLEDMDAASIGEITGLSPANVAMRVHRIKNILAKRFQEGARRAG